MSSIDEKKKEKNNETTNDMANKNLTLIATVASQLIHLGIIIVFGTGMLYTCRGAQTNLFPTCADFAPYTDVIPTFSIPYVETNVNITKGENGNTSTKMTFDINENMKMISNGSFFSWFRNLTEGPGSNQFKLYLGSIMQSVLAFNFTILNSLYQTCNRVLPEILIILLLPYITFFVYLFLGCADFFYFLYLIFAKLFVFCGIKKETGNPDKTTWEHPEGAIWSIGNWWKIVAACFFYWVPLLITIPFIPIAIFYSFFFPLFLKTNVKDKKYGPISLFKDVLKFKRNIFMFILSFFLISDMSSIFGAAAAVGSVIICVGLYFFTGIFHRYEPKASDGVSGGLASYNQTVKTCGKLQEIDKNFVPIAEPLMNSDELKSLDQKVDNVNLPTAPVFPYPDEPLSEKIIPLDANNDASAPTLVTPLQEGPTPTATLPSYDSLNIDNTTPKKGGSWKNRSRKSRA